VPSFIADPILWHPRGLQQADVRVAFKVRARASSALLEDVQRSLLQGVDKLSAENAELRARLDCVEQKDARPELRAVR
jgi:hypothetical protein